MRYLPFLGLALGLGACVDPAPLVVPDHHPASPVAPAGAIDLPSALADYVTPDGFATRAAGDDAAQAARPADHGAHRSAR